MLLAEICLLYVQAYCSQYYDEHFFMHTLYEVSSSSEDENNEEELAKSFDQQVLQVCTAYSHAGEK